MLSYLRCSEPAKGVLQIGFWVRAIKLELIPNVSQVMGHFCGGSLAVAMSNRIDNKAMLITWAAFVLFGVDYNCKTSQQLQLHH